MGTLRLREGRPSSSPGEKRPQVGLVAPPWRGLWGGARVFRSPPAFCPRGCQEPASLGVPLGRLSKPCLSPKRSLMHAAISGAPALARPWGGGRKEGASQPAGPRAWVEGGGREGGRWAASRAFMERLPAERAGFSSQLCPHWPAGHPSHTSFFSSIKGS